MGKKETPQPQALTSVPSAPTFSDQISEYMANYPKLLQLQQQYGPQLAQMDLDLTKQFSPQYSDFLNSEQQRLTPNTFGLQEQLAKLAADNMGGGLPDGLRSSYVDQLRAEIGPNAGSGIGGDYVSTNLLKLGENYRNYYQNLGLSLLSRSPINQPAQPNFQNPVGNFGIGDLANFNLGGYQSYLSGTVNQPFYVPGGGTGGSMLGGAASGAASGAIAGSALGPYGAAIGGVAGGLMGAFGGKK